MPVLEEPVMEGLTRLVSESLARYGLDRPVDYRRLQWSRWFRCESLHSLLHVPSKPGVFALAEEVTEFGKHVGVAAGCPGNHDVQSEGGSAADREGHDSSRAFAAGRRMLSVLQFREDDDMAFVLDRMISGRSAQLSSGRCFVRFVVIEDALQRRGICNALNQWLVSTAETVTGIGAHFATSLEFGVGRTLLSTTANTTKQPAQAQGSELGSLPRRDTPAAQASPLDSGFATNIHCPHPLPSGF
jgi:hypothetical protein